MHTCKGIHKGSALLTNAPMTGALLRLWPSPCIDPHLLTDRRSCDAGASARVRPIPLRASSSALPAASKAVYRVNGGDGMAGIERIISASADVQGTFCCGGELQLTAPIKLFSFDPKVPDAAQQQALITQLPANDSELLGLLSRCERATFGKGLQDMLDPSYRSALCMSPAAFSSSFRLEEHSVLSTIRTLMMPEAAAISAQLYKLNVYRQGDFFKSHVDTPRGAAMFGSLVVCLPQPHAGGQLRITPPTKSTQQQPCIFDWGPTTSDNAVQWAAFYSDCPHDIQPVQSGHRITLTYNLSVVESPRGAPAAPLLPGLSADRTALHAALSAALADPQFMPSGGTLGFGCAHAYPHTQEGLYQNVPSLLKGGDAALLAVGRGLGLQVDVKAVYDLSKLLVDRNTWHLYDSIENDDLMVTEEDTGETYYRLGELAPPKSGLCYHYDYFEGGRRRYLQEQFRRSKSARKVTWVQPPSTWALQLVHTTYGNETNSHAYYSAAALLMTVPAWGTPLRS